MRLLATAMERVVQLGVPETEWEVSDEALKLFPVDIRAYFRPRTA